MIKDMRYFYAGIACFILAMVINFPFPHDQFGTVEILDIATTDMEGNLVISGVITLLFLLVSMFFIVKSLEKYHIRVLVIVIILFIFSPNLFVDFYQKTFASDIYAVSYDREESTCEFTMDSQEKLQGVCVLSFENHSQDDVEFTVDFYDQYWFEGERPALSLMNQDAPFTVKLGGNHSVMARVETSIEVSEMEHQIQGGSFNEINIKIKSENGEREL